MSKILYGLFYLLSLLPLFILYGIADIFFLILYYVVGYRKDVVMKNLRIAFPEKTEAERKTISRRFFRNFMHTWIETIKFLSISEKQVNKMISGDYNLFYDLHENKQLRITLLSGHFMNWELNNFCLPQHQPYPLLAVYMHITNKPLNDLFLKLRSRFGSNLLRAGEMRTAMMPWRNKEYIMGLGADQSPGHPTNAVWLNYFGRPTAFVTGPEKNARMSKTPVVMSWIEKKGVGKYQMHFEQLFESPDGLEDYEITRAFAKKLQEIISEQPENYLWTHKRWKHEWKEEYQKLWVDNVPPLV
ncbi:MAG: lysophospholipid acyltransferase family protein [Chitinophagaceae bacterium]